VDVKHEFEHRLSTSPAALNPLDPDGAQAEWRALSAGRWSVVEHFDRDGRRYLVAFRAEGAPMLSPRERAVAALAAAGCSNKAIGYELGIATSTVGGHLASAMRKLGVPSRVEMVARWNAHPRAAATRTAA
jgi:DNA-binding CsgD family transcriptional regulator